MTYTAETTYPPNDPLEHLLRHLGPSFCFDDYQRPTLLRRATSRMSRLGLTDFKRYSEYLTQNPAEGADLCQAFWINETGFFRDGFVWDHLRSVALPPLLARKAPDAPVRVWSAGCASGEEAYSLAMTLAEADGGRQAQIIATDVDEQALAQARRGVYMDWQMTGVSPERRAEFFERVGDDWRVRESLRRGVTLLRQNLLRGRPAGAFDLIACRNTLMYFSRPAQVRVLGRLRRALTEDGYLLLGQAEGTIAYDAGRALEDGFGVAHPGARLYTRRALLLTANG